MKKVGLIINPIAGMGGRVGLKGTDGEDTLEKAIKLGALPQAPKRALSALKELLLLKERIEIITCSGDMGENQARELGFKTRVLLEVENKNTQSSHTIKAAKSILKESADLLIFAGGDGTARDIYNAIGDKMVVIGIPAGVKIHSPVYAINPKNAGKLALEYVMGRISSIKEVEVMDIDEQAFRKNRVSTRLYGYLYIPFEKNLLQGKKAPTPLGEEIAQKTIGLYVVDNMIDDVFYIVGPGSTTRPIMETLKLPNTLFGVDIVYNKRLIKKDACEKEILNTIEGKTSKLIITPIGGQGYLFGRGNQQISSEVIKKVGKENIMVVSTIHKIQSLNMKPFYVDTGTEEMDRFLKGYVRVITGYNEEIMYSVK